MANWKHLKKAVVEMGEGRQGVHVSLQYQPRLSEGSRAERRDVLKQRFEEVRRRLPANDITINMESLSVSAQMVEAVLDFNQYDSLVERLKESHIRVDPLIDREIVSR
jgi:hypothetical protein